jgi:hypothetical protein
MMKKQLSILLLIVTIMSVSCNDDDDGPKTKDLMLNIVGLENLGPDYVYEGWIIVSGSALTTGRFTVNDNGNLSQSSFSLNRDDLDAANTFVLTIEPANGDDPAPSDTHILAGNFSGKTGQLSIAHGAALGDDYMNSAGVYILATPTNGPDTDENSGIWFLNLSSGTPAVGLNLPTLPTGWKYEGWAVSGGQPLTSGKFTAVDMVDEFDGFSSTMPGPTFPGEDYLINAPMNIMFPLDLAGGKAVISIEPDPDNSSAPFLLKPLVGDIPVNATDHMTYNLGQNLNFPTGTVSR